MGFNIQKLCAWSGVAGIAMFFGGMLVAGVFPPPSPSRSMEEVVAFYQDNASRVLAGFLLIMISGMFVMPLVAVISVQLKRIEGSQAPVMTYTQLVSGAVGCVFITLPPVFFLATAFRPERLADITYFINDFAWIMFIIIWPPAFMQCLSIGIAILRDKSPVPVFPRWVAYLNFWVAVGFLPGSLLVFFKSGPFAWNGLFPWWIPATVFGLWFIVMVTAVLKAVDGKKASPLPS